METPPAAIARRCAEQLCSEGWAVLDSCLGHSEALELQKEAQRLEAAGLLEAHRFEFAAEGERREYQHQGRSFLDFEPPPPAAALPLAPGLAAFAGGGFAAQLAAELTARQPKLALSGQVQVKLQLTRGLRGSAPCHYDTSDTAPLRQVTLLLYLGQWQEDYGAELVLQPFLGGAVSVAPLFNRAVVFLSDRMLHSSLAPKDAQARRWLLTLWLHGERVDSVDAHLAPSPWPPLLQRLLAPAVYAELFMEALERSMPPGPALEALKAAQREEIASIEMDESFAAACHSLEGFACCAFFERGISSKKSVLGCMSTWEGVILTVNMKGTCLTSTPLRLVSGLQHSGFVLVLCGPEFVYAAWCQMAD
ncbi:unnamed protein product [Effrenium voratum]|nr:unnamed protein product [Effrenium voratum]